MGGFVSKCKLCWSECFPNKRYIELRRYIAEDNVYVDDSDTQYREMDELRPK